MKRSASWGGGVCAVGRGSEGDGFFPENRFHALRGALPDDRFQAGAAGPFNRFGGCALQRGVSPDEIRIE